MAECYRSRSFEKYLVFPTMTSRGQCSWEVVQKVNSFQDLEVLILFKQETSGLHTLSFLSSAFEPFNHTFSLFFLLYIQ
ncbi:hypothetical protein Peur_042022 [Populus x canadensis]